MRWIIIANIILFSASAFALGKEEWAVGLGMESRLQRDVNPDTTGLKNSPQFYVKVNLLPWAGLIELSQEERESSSGSLHVQLVSRKAAVWGRYEFTGDRWSPFAGLGVGSYFDRVNTSFQSSSDQHSGTRKFMGVGVGIGCTYWDHLLLEVEGRATSVEQNREPVISALFRLGYQI